MFKLAQEKLKYAVPGSIWGGGEGSWGKEDIAGSPSKQLSRAERLRTEPPQLKRHYKEQAEDRQGREEGLPPCGRGRSGDKILKL